MALYDINQMQSAEASMPTITGIVGNPDLNAYVQYYNDVVQATGGQPAWGASQDLSGINHYEAPGIGGMVNNLFSNAPEDTTTGYGWDASRGVRDMSTTDKFFHALGNIGEAIAGTSGFNGWDTSQSVPENVGRFFVSLPTGIASAPFTGTEHLYEGVTRRPITEADASGKMPGDDLTGFQALGSLATGLVDTLGLLGGGSAEVLNAGRNSLRAFRNVAPAAHLGMSGSRFLGRGAGAIAFDTVEEGAEEAFQSVMEDIRYDQLDEGSIGRALEGAAYGAAGGAIMSAGGQMMNSAFDSNNESAMASQSPVPTQSSISEYHKNVGRPVDKNHIAKEAIDYALEREGREHAVPGSSMTLNVVASQRALGHAKVGLDYFTGSYTSYEHGSREAVADMLNTTEEVLDKIFDPNNKLEDQVIQLNQLIAEAKKNKDPYIVIERTPKTSGLKQPLMLYIDEIVPGNILDVHAQVQKMMGADNDGDLTFTYAGSRNAPNAISPASAAAYISSGTGESLFDKDYFTFGHTSNGLEQAKAEIENKYTWAKTQLKTQTPRTLDALQQVYTAIEEMANGDSDVTNFSNKLSLLEARLKDYYRPEFRAQLIKDYPDASDEEIEKAVKIKTSSLSHRIISDIINIVETSTRNTFSTFVENQVNSELEQASKVIDAVCEAIFTKGKIAKNASDAEVLTHALADIFYSFLYGGFPSFRQNGVYYYNALETLDKTVVSALSDKNVFEVFLKAAYQLSEFGLSVENAISTYISTIAVNKVMYQNFKPVDTRNDVEVEEFLKAVEDAINEANELYNNLIKTSSEDTTDTSIKEFKKQFPSAKPRSRVSIEQPVSMANEMLKMFSGVPMQKLFAIDENDPFYGVTLGGAMEYLSLSAYDNPYFGGTKFGSFWRALLVAYKSTESSVGKTLEKGLYSQFQEINSVRNLSLFDFIPKNPDEMLETIPDEAWNLATGLCDYIVSEIGPQAALALHVADPLGLLNSTWGRGIFSGNWDMFVGAFISLTITAKHVTDQTVKTNAYNLYDAMEAYENGITDEYVEAHVEYALREHANDSALDMYFYTQWQENKWEVFNIIKRFTSFGEGAPSLNDKIFELGAITASDATLSDLLVCAFKNSSGSLALSEITNRLVRSQGKLSVAIKDSGKFAAGQVASVRDMIKHNKWTVGHVVGGLRAAYHHGSIRPSRAALTAAVDSAYGVYKFMVEKGLTAESASQLYDEVSHALVGNLFSSIEAIDYGIGRMRLGNFLANRYEILKLVFEPGSEITVVYEDADGTPHDSTLSYADFYRTIKDDFKDTEEASEQLTWQLIETYPQLLTLAMPQRGTPLYSGDNTSSAYGMANTPMDYLTSYMDASPVDVTRATIEDSIVADLASDETFYQMIVAMTPELESLPLEAKTKAVNQAADELVTMFTRLIAVPDNEFETFKQEYHTDSLADSLTATIDNAILMASDYVDRTIIAGGLQLADNEVITSVTQAVLQVNLFDLMKQHNLQFTQPDHLKHLSAGNKIIENHFQDLADIFHTLSRLSSSEVFRGIVANQIYSLFNVNLHEIIDAAQGKEADKKAVKKLLGIDPATNKLDNATKFYNALVGGLKASDDITTLVLDPSERFDSVDDLIERCETIAAKFSGEVTSEGLLSKKDRDAIEKAYKGDETDIAKLYQKYNGIILAGLLQRMSQGTGEKLNPYAASQTIDLYNWLVNKATEFRNAYRKEGIAALAPGTNIKINPPTIDLSGAAIGFATSNVGQIMRSAPIQTSVALEAANLSKIVGYGWLNSPDTKCDHKGREVRVEDLSDDSSLEVNPDKLLEYNYSLEPGGETHRFTERTLNWLQSQQIDKIYVYENHYCGLLSCSNCTPRNRTLVGTIDALINGMTEDANLRLKKTLEKLRSMVINPHDYGLKTSYDVTNLQEILFHISWVRTKLGEELEKEVTAIAGDLKFNRQNWDILATAMTPYVTVVSNAGNVYRVSINELHRAINGESSEKMAALVQEGFSSVRINLVGLDEMSAKIVHAVETYADECFEKGEQFSDAEARKRARATAENWDTYTKKLDAKSVLERIHYVSAAAKDVAYSDHGANPVVELLSSLPYGTRNTNIFMHSGVDWATTAKEKIADAGFGWIDKTLGPDNEGKYYIGSITISLPSNQKIDGKTAERWLSDFQNYSSLINNRDLKKGLGTGGFAYNNNDYTNIVEIYIGSKNDPEALIEAYQNAKARNHYFAIPHDHDLVETFNNSNPSLTLQGAAQEVAIQDKTGKYTSFVVYNPMKLDLLNPNYQTGYQIAYKEIKGHPKDRFFLCVEDKVRLAIGDSTVVLSQEAAARLEYTHHGVSEQALDSMIPEHEGRGQAIEIMTFDDLQTLANEILAKGDEAQINAAIKEKFEGALKHYESLKWINEEALIVRIKAYLELVAGKDTNRQITYNDFVADASKDDCIGIIRKGNYLLPIFFTASNAPRTANVHFEINFSGKLELWCDGQWNAAEENDKISPYGISFKSIAVVVDDEHKDALYKVNNHGLPVYQDGRVDAHVNAPTFAGRVFGFNVTNLAHNLYDISVITGGNIFFDFELDGNEFKAIKKSNVMLNDNDLQALMEGSPKVWREVLSNSKPIFSDGDLNDLVISIGNDIFSNSGNSDDYNGTVLITNFFCPGYVARENGEWVFKGLLNGYGNYVDMVLSKYQREQILKLYHHMNPYYCPDKIGGNSKNCFFDEYGRIEVEEEDENGNKVYVRQGAILTPIASMEIGGSFGNLSHGARYSGQAMQKVLLSRPFLSDTVAYNTAQYTQLKLNRAAMYLNDNRTLKEKAESFKESRLPFIDVDLQKRVKINSSDEILLRAKTAYRKTCLEHLEQMDREVKIIKAQNDPESVISDPDKIAQLENLAKRWNEALKLPPNKYFTWQQITRNLRLIYGFENGEVGFNELTFDQAKRGIEDSIASIEHDGLIVPAKKYYGQKHALRISIPLLPREYMRMLFNMSPTLQEHWHNDMAEFKTAMTQELVKTTMPAIEAIDDRAKRNALKRMVDGLAYSHGDNTIALHLFNADYLGDVIEAIMKFGTTDAKKYADIASFYEEKSRLTPDRVQRLEELAFSRNHEVQEADYGWGKTLVTRYSTDKRIGEKILRGLVSLRSTLGVLYAEMPFANIGERIFNQGTMSVATHLGQSGIGVYKTDFKIDPDVKKAACHDPAVVKFWTTLREAQLAGVDRVFLANIHNTQDIDEAIKRTFEDASILERINNKVIDVVSGKNILIEGQIRLFIDRFCMYVPAYAPLWAAETSVDPENPNLKVSLMEQSLRSDPLKFFLQVFGGDIKVDSGVRVNDMDIAARCMNWALRGDMAQKNLISAIYAELARQHAGVSFFTSALVTPYFNYMTNRAGRLLQWVAPISSIHYLAVKFCSEGAGAKWKIPGTNQTLGDLMLEDVQLSKDFREAVMLDTLHLGPQIIALMLLGMGALEPPEDEDKWGNFKEWQLFGARIDANWWIEDMLGLALPYAAFGASCAQGKPRVDLIVNGLVYYLGNNPIVKVADAVDVLFDPLAEFYKDYENDVEGYARAMGGAPSIAQMVNGKATSFGLSFVAQFITPGFLREIYNQGIDAERSYKKIYQENEYGRLTAEGEQGEKVQYTTYEDAIIRKHTRNNPVMGLLADLILRPNTGYMAHEMPKTIIYDPYQTNALNYFSLYNDPYTKTEEKTDLEKDALAIEIIGTLQSNSIENLVKQGFALDYETKQYVSKYIHDILAEEKQIYNDFCASEYSDYYYYSDFNEGKAIVQGIRNAHDAIVQEWNDLYYNKLWSDEITIAKYNRVHTKYAQDDNGEWYATGYYPQSTIAGVIPAPVSIAPGESPGEYKTNMGSEYDWQTESIVTGLPTGMRGLVPWTELTSKTPSINSWSIDGTDTGLSDRAANSTSNGSASGTQSGDGLDTTSSGYPSSGYPKSSTRSGTTRRGSSSATPRSYGYSSGGSGGGSGGGYPSIYSRVNAPNISNPDTMRGSRIYDASYDALRPNFETKGSREAYKRSDI